MNIYSDKFVKPVNWAFSSLIMKLFVIGGSLLYVVAFGSVGAFVTGNTEVVAGTETVSCYGKLEQSGEADSLGNVPYKCEKKIERPKFF